VLGVPPGAILYQEGWELLNLPLALGGWGLVDFVRITDAARAGAVAQVIPILQRHFPDLAAQLPDGRFACDAVLPGFQDAIGRLKAAGVTASKLAALTYDALSVAESRRRVQASLNDDIHAATKANLVVQAVANADAEPERAVFQLSSIANLTTVAPPSMLAGVADSAFALAALERLDSSSRSRSTPSALSARSRYHRRALTPTRASSWRATRSTATTASATRWPWPFGDMA
jgi:hypothetical protein